MKTVIHKTLPDYFAPNVPAYVVATIEGNKLSLTVHPVGPLGDIMGNEFDSLDSYAQGMLALEMAVEFKKSRGKEGQ